MLNVIVDMKENKGILLDVFIRFCRFSKRGLSGENLKCRPWFAGTEVIVKNVNANILVSLS